MKIAIVGAGWMGCHLALKLKENHDVVIYEEDEIFSKTSLKNQNRLHLGFHYARNSLTRNLCKDTFDRFITEYGNLVSDIPNNIYAVPQNGSTVDFVTYLKIFEGWEYEQVELDSLVNVEGVIRVQEKHINPIKSKEFFTKKLNNVIKYKKITEKSLKQLSLDNDLVINCTNNVLNRNDSETHYELNTLFVYEKISDTKFDALTFVDGNLFSIFPYLDGTYLVSHVKHCPDPNIDDETRVNLIEDEISKYFPDFKNSFKLIGSNKSFKSKVKNTTDPRIPIFKKENNIINIFTGKIQGIFQAEDFIKEEIKNMNKMTREDLTKLFTKYLERNPNEEEYSLYEYKDKEEFEKELAVCQERLDFLNSPRVAVLIVGHPRDMNFLNTSDRIINSRTDFFVFSWDQMGHWGQETDLNLPSMRESLEETYNNHPKIKKYLIESNKDYIENNPVDETIKFFNFQRAPEINIKSQLYSVKKAYQLMEEYMKENNIKYDIVLKTRFEMGIKKFDVNKDLADDVNNHKIIFFPDSAETGHGHPHASFCTRCETAYSAGLKTRHLFNHPYPVCDTYAYGSVESMKKYCSLYDVYEELCKSFEKHNLDTIDKININYQKRGETYVIDLTAENDVKAMEFLYCSYPERSLMYLLEDYILPRSRNIVLVWYGN